MRWRHLIGGSNGTNINATSYSSNCMSFLAVFPKRLPMRERERENFFNLFLWNPIRRSLIKTHSIVCFCDCVRWGGKGALRRLWCLDGLGGSPWRSRSFWEHCLGFVLWWHWELPSKITNISTLPLKPFTLQELLFSFTSSPPRRHALVIFTIISCRFLI